MKLKAALAASLLALAAPAGAETVSYAPGLPMQRHVLKNGLTVLLLPLKTSPVTTYHTWVKAGSRDEKPGITGIAHLFEHMMFRPVHPDAKSYFDQASALGMRYNASTRFNATDYWSTFTPASLPKVVAIESDRIEHLHVTKEMLDVEREAVRSEYSTKLDAVPTIDLWFQIYRLAFPGHPYGWHIVGVREDLDRITAEDCNRFFEANYAPNNAMIAVAGPIDPAATLKLIDKAYGGWHTASNKQAWANPAKPGTTPLAGKGKLPAPTKYILVGYRTPERTQADRLAQDLTHYMLFNESTSLVGKRLRDETHIASESDAFNTFYDIALSKLLVVPNPGITPERVVTEVQGAIDGFKQLPAVDFEAQKRAYATYLRESQLTSYSMTNALGLAWAYDGNYQDAFRDPADVLKIPRAQIQHIIDTTYAPTNRVMVVTP
ncbi:MAG: peptidase M16-like protein [Cyanobacteria bacterium RYN_339]|nr:peptidase M16-like protein [Cyanobacteria bacterium RYN_339]